MAEELLEAVEGQADGEHTLAALVGIGYALLDVAAAIREQTREFADDGIRAKTERNA